MHNLGDAFAKLKDVLIILGICFIAYLAGNYLTDGDKLLTVFVGAMTTLGAMAGVQIGRSMQRSSDNKSNNQPNGGSK